MDHRTNEEREQDRLADEARAEEQRIHVRDKADHARDIARLTAERDEARAWVRRLTATERVLTCVYCGEAYPPGTPDHGADVLTAHVRTCAKHPMREAEAEVERLRDLLVKAIGHLEDPAVATLLLTRMGGAGSRAVQK